MTTESDADLLDHLERLRLRVQAAKKGAPEFAAAMHLLSPVARRRYDECAAALNEFEQEVRRNAEKLVLMARAGGATRKRPDLCSVCAGEGTPGSGRPCICGGAGSAVAEMQGLREALYDARVRINALEEFALAVLQASGPVSDDVDAGDLQEIAERYGMLVPTEVTEPCGPACVCGQWDDFPQTCYRLDPALARRAKDQAAVDDLFDRSGGS